MRQLVAFVLGIAVNVSAGAQEPQLPSSSPADRDRVGRILGQREPTQLEGPVAEDFAPIYLMERLDPITDAPVIAASDVQDQVTAGELVLGVVVNGEARAYPINMLTGPQREVINDTLSGQPIAATWCHLCNNAIVYDRRVDGRTLTLGVSGMLWRRNLVMHDVETGSLWAHLTGTAMQGDLIGKELTVLPATLTTWDDWRSAHPDTTVLDMSRTAAAYEADVFAESERFAYGWNLIGRAQHISIAALEDDPVRNLTAGNIALLLSYDAATSRVVLASRRLGEDVLSFERVGDGTLRDNTTGSVWDPVRLEATAGPLKGRRLSQRPGQFVFLDAWIEFFPDSEALD